MTKEEEERIRTGNYDKPTIYFRCIKEKDRIIPGSLET